MTNQHPIDPSVFDFRDVNFDDYDEDYADDRSEPELPTLLSFFKRVKNDEVRQKVEEWRRNVLG